MNWWIKKLMDEWLNEWINNTMNETINGWMKQWMDSNAGVICCLITSQQ